jgi:O-antigen ligase
MTPAGALHIVPITVRPRVRVPAALRLPVLAQVAVGAGVAATYLILLSAHSGFALAALFVTLGAAVLSPPAAFAALAVIVPMPEPELLSPPGIVAVLVAASAMGLVLRIPFERPSVRVSPGIVLVLGYLLLSAVSLIPTITNYPVHEETSATLEFIHMASGVGVFLIAVYLFRTVPAWPILAITGAMATLAAIVAIADFGHVTSIVGLFSGLAPLPDEARAAGLFSNSNYFAFFSSQVLILLIAMLGTTRRASRLLVGVAVVAVAVGLALSLSRGGYLGAGTGLFVLLWLRNRRAAIALLVAAILAVLVLYPVFLAFRLTISAGSTDLSAYLDQQRSEHWREQAFGAGIQMFLGSPVLGVGFGMFQFLSPAFIGFSPATYSHDQWLDLLAEQGIVGVGFMLAIIASLMVALRHATHPLRNAAIAMLVAYAVESLFINSLTSIQISGTIFLVLALVLARRPDAAPDSQPAWRHS